MSEQHPTTTNWFGVGVVVASGIVAALQVGKVAIAVPALRADLGLDLAAAGWVMAIFSILGVVGGIPTGAAVNRFGDRRLLTIGLLAIALGSAAGACAGGYGMLLFARLIEGLGFLLITIAGPTLLQRVVAAENRDLAYGMWSAFMPTGMAVALLIGSVLEGWRGFWLANAVLALLMFAFVTLAVSPGRRPPERASWRELGRDAGMTIKAGGPPLLASAFAVYALQYFALFTFLPVLLVERIEVSVAVAGTLSAIAVGGISSEILPQAC